MFKLLLPKRVLPAVQRKTITIIGGGACGTAAFIELFLQFRLEGLHHHVQINIIEKSDKIGPGMAFGTSQKGHMLNTQADLMGIHVQEPAHFSTWLQSHQQNNEIHDHDKLDEAYTTRRFYGDYLQQQFDFYQKQAEESGLKVNTIYGEVVTLDKTGNGWTIKLDNGETVPGDYVLLMPGTPESELYADLKKHERYISSPWPSKKMMDKISKDDDVAVLGAGLSAIDAVMTLADHDHRGKITMFSPDGLLPRVQPVKEPDYECRFLNLQTIHFLERKKLKKVSVKELFRLYKQDVQAFAGKNIDWKRTGRIGKSAEYLLDEDIRLAEKDGDALMAVAYATRQFSSELWLRLSDEQKILFKKWFGPYWTVTRHGMPLPNARRLQKLFKSGQLSVKPALSQVDFKDKKSCFDLSYGDEKTSADCVVNAIGPASAIEKMESELIKNLAEKGIIRAEKTGGITIDPATMQVIGANYKAGTLYTAGHLANGTLLDVNAVWFNIRTIGLLCRHLAQQFYHEHYA